MGGAGRGEEGEFRPRDEKEGMVEEHAVSLWSSGLLCRIQLAYAWQRMSNAQRAYHKFNMPSGEAI